MVATGRKIAQNTSFLTIAYIMQKILAFVYFTLIARWIGAEDIGQYSFALSFVTIFSIMMDFGLSPVLIREAAKRKEKAEEYLNTIISAKAVLSIFAIATTVIVLQFLDKSLLVHTMVYMATAVMLLDSFSVSFWGVFRSFQNLKYESIAIILNQVIILTVGVAGILLQFPLYILVIALLSGSIFNFSYALILLHQRAMLRIRFVWDSELLKRLIKIALPFALAGVFTKVYSHIDQILLSTLVGDKELGWYSIAYKLTFAFLFIPAAFAGAIYPAMSAYYVEARDKLVNVFEKSMFFLMIVSVPISVGIAALADKIILALYTAEFAPSIPALQIWIAVLAFVFMGYPVGALLNATDRQTINTVNMGITMVLNVVLNIVLIPRLSYIGASIAGLTSWAVLFFLNLYWASTIIAYSKKFLLLKLIQTLIAGAVMGATVILLKESLHFVIVIAIGVIIYPLTLYIIRGFSKDDIEYIKTSIFKKV